MFKQIRDAVENEPNAEELTTFSNPERTAAGQFIQHAVITALPLNPGLFQRAYRAALTRLVANERVVGVVTVSIPTQRDGTTQNDLLLTVITEPEEQ